MSSIDSNSRYGRSLRHEHARVVALERVEVVDVEEVPQPAVDAEQVERGRRDEVDRRLVGAEERADLGDPAQRRVSRPCASGGIDRPRARVRVQPSSVQRPRARVGRCDGCAARRDCTRVGHDRRRRGRSAVAVPARQRARRRRDAAHRRAAAPTRSPPSSARRRWSSPSAALRARAREYADELAARWPRSRVVFASKAFPCTAVQRVMVEEGLGPRRRRRRRDRHRAEGRRGPGAARPARQRQERRGDRDGRRARDRPGRRRQRRRRRPARGDRAAGAHRTCSCA